MYSPVDYTCAPFIAYVIHTPRFKRVLLQPLWGNYEYSSIQTMQTMSIEYGTNEVGTNAIECFKSKGPFQGDTNYGRIFALFFKKGFIFC